MMTSKCSSRYLFFSLGANGMSTGLGGTVVFRGHPHGALSSLVVTTFCYEVRVGKLEGSGPKFFKVNSNKLYPDVFSDTYMVCVSLDPVLMWANIIPFISSWSSMIPLIRWVVGTRHSSMYTRALCILEPQEHVCAPVSALGGVWQV